MSTEPATDTAGEPSLDLVRLASLPALLDSHQRWDDLFRLARCAPFLQHQATEFAAPTTSVEIPSPLDTLDLALRRAIALDRAPEMAAFTVAAAQWNDALGDESPLVLLRDGQLDRAMDFLQLLGPEDSIPWRLLLAWELADTGNLGPARRILRELAGREPPNLRTASARQAVYLLRRTQSIDPEAFDRLQRQLFDDNDKSELGTALIDEGALAPALLVASSIAYFHRQRVARLIAIAKAHARRGEAEAADRALARAEADLGLIEGGNDRAESLAALACARALRGDTAAARAGFDEAINAALTLSDSASTLAAIGQQQAEAGLLDDAEQTATLRGRGTLDFHYPKEILETVALAAADRGDTDRALRLLPMIGPSYIDYPRALRNVARRVATHGEASAVLPLLTELPGDEQRKTLRAMVGAAAKAGHLDEAAELAGRLEDEAAVEALVDLALAPGSPAAAWQRARREVEHAGLGSRAELLARLATAVEGTERDRVFRQARAAATESDQESRWRLLATVGAWQASVGDPLASGTFIASRQAKRASRVGSSTEDDRDEWWDLGVFQDRTGDPSGARECFAEALRVPSRLRGFATWALPLTLAGIALTQAKSADAPGARITADAALRAAAEIPEDERGLIAGALADVFAETGDFETALNCLTSAAPDPDSWQALTKVTTKMAEAGLREAAQRMLAALASDAEDQFEGAAFGASEPIAALACARAKVGDLDGAREVASWDASHEASSQVEFLIVQELLARGELEAATELAEQIWSPPWQVKAYCTIAASRQSQGDAEGSRAAFSRAVAAAEEDRAEVQCRLILDVARAQHESGAHADLNNTVAAALDAARAIDYSDERDRALSAIAQAQGTFGDVDAAQRTTSAIRNLWFVGEAQCMTALAAGAQAHDPNAAVAIAECIESPWWRAVAQAAVFAVKDARNDADAWAHWARAQQAMNEVPEGDARSRLQEAIVSMALETGNTALALRFARDYTTDRELRLARLVRDLARRGAADSVREMLPDCARYVSAAYAACQALAEVEPVHASSISEELIRAGAR